MLCDCTPELLFEDALLANSDTPTLPPHNGMGACCAHSDKPHILHSGAIEKGAGAPPHLQHAEQGSCVWVVRIAAMPRHCMHRLYSLHR